jgi:hypothetical protein
MSPSPWQRLALIFPIALGIISTVLAVIAITRLLPTAIPDPADVLPAAQTQLLLQNVDHARAQAWAAFFGAPPPPDAESNATLALLGEADQSTWIVLTPDGERDPPWRIEAHEPGTISLVGNLPDRLSGSRAYGIFAHPAMSGNPRMWWRADRWETQTLIPSSIAKTLRSGTLTMSGTVLELSLLTRTLPRFSSLAAPPEIAGAGFLWLQYPQTLIEASEQFPVEVTAALQGLLAKRLRSTLGDGVSLAYDLVPLLEGPAMLRIDRGSGASALILHGKGGDDLPSRLSTLFEKAKNAAQNIELDRRDIEGFIINEVREDAGAAAEETIEIGGWTAAIRMHGSGQAVCVAQRGSEFLIATRRDACLQGMANHARASSIITGTVPLAILRMEGDLLTEMRALELPGLAGFLLDQAPNDGVDLTAEWKGELLQLRMEEL